MTQDLHPLWDFAAFSWEGEDRPAPILTFFVDHRDLDPHYNHGRDVHLFQDYHQWEDQIKRAWRDLIQDGQPVELYLAQPQPCSLCTCCSSSRSPSGHVSRRAAVTANRHILFEDILMALQVAEQCLGPTATHVCTGWFDRIPLTVGHPLLGHNGYGIVIQLRSPAPPIPAHAIDVDLDQDAHAEATCLLHSFTTRCRVRKAPNTWDGGSCPLAFLHRPTSSM